MMWLNCRGKFSFFLISGITNVKNSGAPGWIIENASKIGNISFLIDINQQIPTFNLEWI